MKGLLKIFVLSALLVTPLLAKNTQSITISQPVSVGTTQIAPGDYKVSWEGAGPAVKVTLSTSGKAPILLDAKLVPDKNYAGGVLVGTTNGVRVLQEIHLGKNSLVFGAPSAEK